MRTATGTEKRNGAGDAPALTGAAAAVAREFDAKAAEYESNRLANWYKAQGAIVLDSMHDFPAGGTVLDIGCGTGWFVLRLLERHADASAIGIDLSGGMIDTARGNADLQGIDRAAFMQGDWDDPETVGRVLGLNGGAPVQAIVCASAFHYFQDPVAAVTRMRACLADGGELTIVERARRGSLLTGLWDWAHRHLIRDHARFHDEHDVLDFLRAAGFANARIERRLRRYLWNGKLYTSIAIIRATAGGPPVPATHSTPKEN